MNKSTDDHSKECGKAYTGSQPCHFAQSGERSFPGGIWPVMLTVYKEDGSLDEAGLRALTAWYLEKKVDGLFAVCQSSEMFQMSLEERLRTVEIVTETAAGRVPVIAAGNISPEPADRVDEAVRIYEAGADAVILITNMFAAPEESDEVWLERCLSYIAKLPAEIPLGFYECPYPYRRLISDENLKVLRDTGRFYFLKDVCCDLEVLKRRIDILKDSSFGLYNANTTTLLESLRAGACGFSGVMANIHPELYVELMRHAKDETARARMDMLQNYLTVASLIERQYYPVNAKYYLSHFEKLPITTISRRQDRDGLTETFKTEIAALKALGDHIAKEL